MTTECRILKCGSIEMNVSHVILNGHVNVFLGSFGLTRLKHHLKVTYQDTFHLMAVRLRIPHCVVVAACS